MPIVVDSNTTRENALCDPQIVGSEFGSSLRPFHEYLQGDTGYIFVMRQLKEKRFC